MARNPTMEAPPPRGDRLTTAITQIRHYRLITPLFGGGVNPKQADPISTVRASEVRGQLRFWWRATRGGAYATLAELKQAEGALWGSTSEESKIQVVVSQDKHGEDISSFSMPDGKEYGIGKPQSPISYATFALREGGALRIGVTFSLTMRFPKEKRADVEAALWAWETFGGIGARTRRGFGALDCLSVSEDNLKLQPERPETHSKGVVLEWLNKKIDHFTIRGTAHPAIPRLDGAQLEVGRRSQDFTIYLSSSNPNYSFQKLAATFLSQAESLNSRQIADAAAALTAWYYPINQLKRFRQSRTDGRKRSFWPEPDAIRYRMKNGFRGRHQEPMEKTRNIRKFPRAVFGLPIIFEFKDKDIDPPTTTLQGIGHNRMASPLVLRPLYCADGTYASVALVFNMPHLPPDGLELVSSDKDRSMFDKDAEAINTQPLTGTEASQIVPLKGEPDVLFAFLKTL